MPIYDYVCDNGHITERRAPLSLEYINCPECEAAARRAACYREQHLVGLETGPRYFPQATKDGDIKNKHGQYRVGLWNENMAEVKRSRDKAGEAAHEREREERRSGPNPFDMALRRAATENKVSA
jgi:hypothetical protein